MQREVTCRLDASIVAATDIVLSLAAAAPPVADETLSVVGNGESVTPVELQAEHGTRLHLVEGLQPGSLTVTYEATVAGRPGELRDYAHLTIAILRACDTPARMTSVYAPGLEPMDFHAVVEAYVDGRWLVVDATALAPVAGSSGSRPGATLRTRRSSARPVARWSSSASPSARSRHPHCPTTTSPPRARSDEGHARWTSERAAPVV
jgi:hypothetical protein